MNVKIIYYCYIIYLIFHCVLLNYDIFRKHQISPELMNILAVYQKQEEKSRQKSLVAVSFLSISTSKVLTGWEVNRIAVQVLGFRRQISNGQRFAAVSGVIPPFHGLTEYPLPIAKLMSIDILRAVPSL